MVLSKIFLVELKSEYNQLEELQFIIAFIIFNIYHFKRSKKHLKLQKKSQQKRFDHETWQRCLSAYSAVATLPLHTLGCDKYYRLCITVLMFCSCTKLSLLVSFCCNLLKVHSNPYQRFKYKILSQLKHWCVCVWELH